LICTDNLTHSHLLIPYPRRMMSFKPALVIVDVQEDFCPPVSN
jgi:hypothetical protein